MYIIFILYVLSLQIKYYTIDRMNETPPGGAVLQTPPSPARQERGFGILICPWILILTNDNFAGKEEAADFYSFQGELVACLCVLSVIIITIIVNIANVMKIAVKVIVADNKYLGF